MRAQAKRIRHEEEEESAFVSMTDMTVGFLFIMMILLAFFASQTRETETVPMSRFESMVSERDEWRATAKAQEATITDLKDQLEKLKKERAALLLTIERKDEEISKKDQTISELEKEIERLQQRLKDLEIVDPLEAYLARVTQTRREMLTRLRDAIRADFPDLQIELSEESDALRFQGEGLFASNRSDLARDRRDIVARLAQRLNEVLPCFTIGQASQFDRTCNSGFVMIEAVQIEGHTDNVGTDRLNRTLSAARANNTFFAMTQAAQGVMEHLNLKSQPVLSVAAYGPDRPVAPNDTQEGRATNRRIDLRFIMVTPQDTDGIEVVREALESVVDQP
ncbi:OmpA family protein [Thalassospira tepidiphila]|uniref:OmpA/MotB family protein n=2 Tax=Alphaproteobacteria TaxID=28211 RepID=UPI003AA9AAC3